MEDLTSKKYQFIGLSCLSIGCLIGSFAYPLQKLELYRQTEKGQFDIQYIRTYVITENSLNYPYGFQKDKARKFAQIHVDYKWQKILLLAMAAGCAATAISIGAETVPLCELDEEVNRIKAEAKKELSLKGIKHRFALASKSQQLLFLDEMKALIAEFGSMESEIQEVDELTALYDQVEENQLGEDSNESKPSEESFRNTFPEQMDTTSWKACLKAMGDGAGREEIIKEVLGGGEAAGQYFDFLKGKYL